jgi:hypothetical protein
MSFKVTLERSIGYNLRSKKTVPLQLEQNPHIFPQTLIQNYLVPCCEELILKIVDSEKNTVNGEIFIFPRDNYICNPCNLMRHSVYFPHFGMPEMGGVVRKDFGARIIGSNLGRIAVKFNSLHSCYPPDHKVLPNCNCFSFLHIVGMLNDKIIETRLGMRIQNEDQHIQKPYLSILGPESYKNCTITSCHYLNKGYSFWKKQHFPFDHTERQLYFLYSAH